MHKSAAVNFYDFCFCSQFDSESYIDYKSDRIISGMHLEVFLIHLSKYRYVVKSGGGTIGGKHHKVAAGNTSLLGFGDVVGVWGRLRVEWRTIADDKWVSRCLGKKVGGTFTMLSPPPL